MLLCRWFEEVESPSSGERDREIHHKGLICWLLSSAFLKTACYDRMLIGIRFCLFFFFQKGLLIFGFSRAWPRSIDLPVDQWSCILQNSLGGNDRLRFLELLERFDLFLLRKLGKFCKGRDDFVLFWLRSVTNCFDSRRGPCCCCHSN